MVQAVGTSSTVKLGPAGVPAGPMNNKLKVAVEPHEKVRKGNDVADMRAALEFAADGENGLKDLTPKVDADKKQRLLTMIKDFIVKNWQDPSVKAAMVWGAAALGLGGGFVATIATGGIFSVVGLVVGGIIGGVAGFGLGSAFHGRFDDSVRDKV